MIDRKKTQYVILYVNHNIKKAKKAVYSSCAMGPKSFSAVMAIERRRLAQSERHQKQYISGASGGFFSGCRSGSKTKIF